MKNFLVGKSALITGAGSGIGRAAALYFARAGALVTAVDVNGTAAEETCKLAIREGGKAQFIVADIASEPDVEASVSEAVRAYGRLDCAFNNAGIFGPLRPIADFSLEEWEGVLRTDLTGTFLCVKHEIRAMLLTGGGSIVNNSSSLAEHGRPGYVAYCSAKSGVLGLTRAAAIEYGRSNIRVNAILPGIVRTPLLDGIPASHLEKRLEVHPLGRLAEPEEIAATAAWLCSAEASFVNGHSLSVDGGAFS